MRAKSRIDEDWVETDPNYRIKQAHGQIMIDRLAKLIHAGYRLDLPRVHEGSELPLVHPNKKVPRIELWDDGLINDQSPSHFLGRDNERTVFEPEDSEGFDRFVANLPKPNLVERIRNSTVEEAFYVILAWTLLIALVFAASNVGERVWGWLQATFS